MSDLKNHYKALLAPYKLYIYLAFLLLALILIVGAFFNQCGERNTEEKKEQLGANISAGKVEANVVGNQINAAAANSNAAHANLDRIKNSNISNVNGSDLDRMAANFGK